MPPVTFVPRHSTHVTSFVSLTLKVRETTFSPPVGNQGVIPDVSAVVASNVAKATIAGPFSLKPTHDLPTVEIISYTQAGEKLVQWQASVVESSLVLAIPNDVQLSSPVVKESFVSVLEIGERLGLARVIVRMKKDRLDLASCIHALMYVGFTVRAPEVPGEISLCYEL